MLEVELYRYPGLHAHRDALYVNEFDGHPDVISTDRPLLFLLFSFFTFGFYFIIEIQQRTRKKKQERKG